MSGVPRAALTLGLASFVLGALMVVLPGLEYVGQGAELVGLLPSTRVGGVFILESFGAAILAFMGGCLWGFASDRPGGPTLPLLALAAVPAFLAFISIRETPPFSCTFLAFGFVLLQTIDVIFHRAGVTPAYWLSLRLPLTAAVIACLLVGATYG